MLDASFNTNANDEILAMALQPDGRILVGGYFRSVTPGQISIGGQPRNRIARLNSDGTADAAFNSSADAEVLTLAAQSDGKILVGGFFSNINGQLRKGITRLNRQRQTADRRF